MKNFSYTSCGSNDTQSASSTFTIPNDCVLVRVRFWYAGVSDPQFGYIHFFKNLPKRYIQTLIYYDYPSNKELKVTADVNWGTMKIGFAALSLPNNLTYVGIEYYK